MNCSSELSDSSYSFYGWVSDSISDSASWNFWCYCGWSSRQYQFSSFGWLNYFETRRYMPNMSFCFQSEDDMTVCPHYKPIQLFLSWFQHFLKFHSMYHNFLVSHIRRRCSALGHILAWMTSVNKIGKHKFFCHELVTSLEISFMRFSLLRWMLQGIDGDQQFGFWRVSCFCLIK